MNIILDRSIKKPLYKQIAEQIEREISSGEISPDVPLFSERVLAGKLNINRSTVVTAYDELEALGLVIRKKGSGTFVNTDIWGIAQKRVPNWGRYVEDGTFHPNLPLVQKLRSKTQENKIINLSSGELSPELLPEKQFASILREHPFYGRLGYDHPLGNELLRETISKHVASYKKMYVHPDSILITSGAQQAIHLIVQCLLKPGDAVAIENPSYAYSLPIFQSAGIRTFLLPVDEHGVNPDDIISLHNKRRIKMLFINPDYQNPTGTKMTMERRKRILKLSSKFGIPIIEDDPYSLTSYGNQVGPTLKSMDDSGNVLYISSLSKIVASGLRIGWIIGPKNVINRLSDAKQQVDYGHSIFPQWVANQFLASSEFEQHIINLRKQLKDYRDIIISSLDKYSDNRFHYYIPEGGIHLWCKLNQEVNEFKLLEKSLQNGVSFVPGKILGSQKGYVRFTYGRGEKHFIDEGIFRFVQVLQSMSP